MHPAVLLLWLAGSGLTGRARAAEPEPVAVDSSAVEAAWRRLQLSQFDMSLAGFAPAAAYAPEEIALGRDMFFDPSLSRDGTLSCSSCHVPALAWTDRLPRALGRGRGAARKSLSRNTLSLLDTPYRRNLFWDGRASSPGEAALIAAANPDEMDMPAEELVARLARSPAYAARFKRIYRKKLDPGLVGQAFAAFVMTSPRAAPSPFERFDADRSALTPLQKRGLILFTGKAHCLRCHNGPFLTDGRVHDVGLKPSGPDPSALRMAVTPPLLDAASTPPYMHDGSLATLADVVDFYNRGGDEGPDQAVTHQDSLIVPLMLTGGEKRALVAFLESLGGAPAKAAAVRTSAPAPAAPQPPPAPAPRYAAGASPGVGPSPDVGPNAPDPAAAAADGEDSTATDPACLKSFSIARFVAGLSAPPKGAPAASGEFVRLLVRYQAAAAFRAGDPGLCDSLKTLGGGAQDVSFACRRKALDMLTLRDLASGGAGYRKDCAQLELTGVRARDERTCSIIPAYIGDPVRLCGLLIENKALLPQQREACLFNFGAYTRYGEPDYCDVPQLPAESLRQCRDTAAFARASRSGRPDDCGDSTLCRLMTDDGALRSSYDELRQLACLKR